MHKAATRAHHHGLSAAHLSRYPQVHPRSLGSSSLPAAIGGPSEGNFGQGYTWHAHQCTHGKNALWHSMRNFTDLTLIWTSINFSVQDFRFYGLTISWGSHDCMRHIVDLPWTSVNCSLHDFRIRGLAICLSHEDPGSGEKWLTSVASDGTINVHRVNATQVLLLLLYNAVRFIWQFQYTGEVQLVSKHGWPEILTDAARLSVLSSFVFFSIW